MLLQPYLIPGRDLGQQVASVGDYSLHRLSDNDYRLYGPDNHYSVAWLATQLPAGEWWTTWSSHGEGLCVTLTR